MPKRQTSCREHNGERKNQRPSALVGTFIDAFAGCGGLSLGLMRAGWRGIFAIEKDAFAFQTLRSNFLEVGSRHPYHWPRWLEKKAWCAEDILTHHEARLRKMSKQVDLLAGGPPCQGFSAAGRRRAHDPRNNLVESYLKLVNAIRPKIILVENVMGITYDFKVRGKGNGGSVENFAARIASRLSDRYNIYSAPLLASRYGVPQARTRFFLVGLSFAHFGRIDVDPFSRLKQLRRQFLDQLGFHTPVRAQAAISDLEVSRSGTRPCPDNPSFDSIAYIKPRTAFQRAMRDGFMAPPPDTKLAKHRPETAHKFENIIALCRAQGRLNVQLSQEMKDSLGMKKMATRVLDPNRPAPTVTGCPEDLLHYKEPRILTVRENARLQSFPDWFAFQGKYATGGNLRQKEVPRYTQVANAVPPLLAEIVGQLLGSYIRDRAESTRTTSKARRPKAAVR